MNFHTIRHIFPVALGHFTIELCNNYLPVVYPILITTLGLSHTQVGFVALVSAAGATLIQPLFGYLSDRLQPRHLIISSIIWIGLLMGLVGLTQNYWLLILLVSLGSLGSAAFHPSGASAASAIATKRRATTLSIFSVSGTLGTALSPLLLTIGLSQLGLPATMMLIPIALMTGWLLYQQPGWGRNFMANSDPIQSDRADDRAQMQNGSLAGLILVTMLVMCRSWFQVSLVTYLPEWLHSQGWSLLRSGQTLTVLLIFTSSGTVIGGILADRIGRWPVPALSLGLLIPAQWILTAGDASAHIGVVMLIGVLIGSSFPVTVVMAQETWPRGVGLASSIVMGLGWLPGGIGASVTGIIADHTSLDMALRWLTLAPVVGLVCAVLYALVWPK